MKSKSESHSIAQRDGDGERLNRLVSKLDYHRRLELADGLEQDAYLIRKGASNKKLRASLAGLNTFERLNFAARLEQDAKKIRDIKPPKFGCVDHVRIPLTANARRAILVFANHFGARGNRRVKLANGARWFLEAALPLIEMVSNHCDQLGYYRDAEGFQGDEYCDGVIGDALGRWQDKLEAGEAEDDDS